VRALCLKCHETVDVAEPNEFTRALGVVCPKCRARFSEPPPRDPDEKGSVLEPAAESAPGSYEDASDLLTESSRHPPPLHRMPPRLPAAAVPSKKRPRFWLSDEESSGPWSSRDPLGGRTPPPPPSSAPNSSITDLRSLSAPPSSRRASRRVDDELVRLGGFVGGAEMSPIPQAPPPAPVEPPDRCPHCGERLDAPPARKRELGTEPVFRGDDPPGASLSTHAPVAAAADAETRSTVREEPRAPRQNLTPWAVAAASLVIAVISISTRHDAPPPGDAAAPPPRSEIETANPPEPSRAAVGETAEIPKPAPATTSDERPAAVKSESADSKPASDSKSVAQAQPAKTASPTSASGAGRAFDRGAAVAALSAAAGRASSCRGGGDPTGIARVTVTFAPSGQATQAQINGPPFAGTATGSCLARVFRQITVPPFEGDSISASKTVSIR